MQNEPNLWAGGPGIADWRLRIADRKVLAGAGAGGKMRKTNPICPGWGVKRAKRTQFRPPTGGWRRELCKTKPNLGGLGYVGKDRCRVGRGPAQE
jgi:hypothetical protein